GQDLLTLQGHSEGVSGVAFSPDGKRLASGSTPRGRELVPGGSAPITSGEVKVWDAQTGQELLTLKGHTTCVPFGPDGTPLASGSGYGLIGTGEVKVWDARTGQELLSLKGHSAGVSSVVFSPDGQRLASASEDKTLKVWDAQTGRELFPLKGHTDRVTS